MYCHATTLSQERDTVLGQQPLLCHTRSQKTMHLCSDCIGAGRRLLGGGGGAGGGGRDTKGWDERWNNGQKSLQSITAHSNGLMCEGQREAHQGTLPTHCSNENECHSRRAPLLLQQWKEGIEVRTFDLPQPICIAPALPRSSALAWGGGARRAGVRVWRKVLRPNPRIHAKMVCVDPRWSPSL